LRGTPGGIRAGVPGADRSPGSTPVRTTASLPAAAGNGCDGSHQLASAGANTGLYQRGACSTGPTARCRRRHSSPAAATGRGGSRGSRTGLLLGAGLLVLGQSGLDMDRRQLDDPALARRNLGAWRLVQAQERLGLAWWALALIDGTREMR